jgi:PLP dependent protein
MSGQAMLQDRHAAVIAKIHEATGACKRPTGSVQLLAVSKTFPAANVLALADCGQNAFGENYVQEAVDKIAFCTDHRPDLKLEWHFIGPIQSNKTKPIAENFAWVHSIERDKIAMRLNEQRPVSMPRLNVCIQVNVSGEASKSGCDISEVPRIATVIASLPRLLLRGIMAIPEATEHLEALTLQFACARQALTDLRNQGFSVDTLSMGMSADMALAIAQGSTIVRVGSALFGARPDAKRF